MANNSTRKSIEFLVEGALPPHSTNVLWMDTSNPELPVLKIFKNGVWTPVTTDNNKTIQLLVEHITSLQEEITNLEEGVQATCDSIEGKVDDITLDLESVATEENATANRLDIKGSDSKNTFDCVTCIPALDWQDYSQLVLTDGEYAIGDWVEDMDSPDTIEEGTVVHAENVDATMPVVLIKKTQSTSTIYVTGDAEDGWTLPPNSISEVIHIESGKNYICTGSVTLAKLRPGQLPLRGSLYLWSEYEGKSIYDATEEIKENINSNTEAVIGEIKGDNPDASLSEVQNLLQTLVDAHIINDTSMLYDGVTFSNGYSPENILLFLLNWHTTARIIDDTNLPLDKKIITIPNVANQLINFLGTSPCSAQIERIKLSELKEILSNARFFSGLPKLTSIELPKIETYNGTYTLEGCPLVTELYWPELKVIGNRIGHNCNIETLRFPKLTTINQYFLSTCRNLIDFETGAYFTTNMNLSAWDPTNALNSGSSSLIKPGETFANNLEKLLYNIREHLAANLPDRTGQSALTITFSSAVKAAILADTDTANAFADKNWTVS